jgi:hypothetical protein
VGKDSGGLPALGISEAAFLASIAIAEGPPADAIVLEEEARSGAENVAFALRLAAKLGYLPPGTQVAGLAPAERSRRLYEELRYKAAAGHFAADVAAGLSSGSADSADPSVQAELVRELRGLATMHRGKHPASAASRTSSQTGSTGGWSRRQDWPASALRGLVSLFRQWVQSRAPLGACSSRAQPGRAAEASQEPSLVVLVQYLRIVGDKDSRRTRSSQFAAFDVEHITGT